MLLCQTRDITMNDLVSFRHGVGEVIWALRNGRKTIDGIEISDYIKNLQENTGICFKDVNISYPRHQNKSLKDVLTINSKGDVFKMGQQLGYAFTWLSNPNEKIDVDTVPMEHLEELANMIDWNNEPDYNKPDFEKDTIEMIRAKLKTVEDKINRKIKDQGDDIDEVES